MKRQKNLSDEQPEEGPLSLNLNKLDTLKRALLESANDYMNPMLREMHRTENMLKSIIY